MIGRKVMALALLCLSASSSVSSASAAGPLQTVKLADNIYALVGPLKQRSPENLGNNATFGVIITSAGVILVDPGGSAKGAAAIESAIAKLTDKPVKIVINSGGQDHRWFGNGYFKAKGARIIASAAAVADQKERADHQSQFMEKLIGKSNFAGTELVHADQQFDAAYEFTLGGVKLDLIHAGPAHTPGDAFVWLPKQKILFAGDIVYLDRMLGVSSHSDSKSWLAVFAEIEKRHPAIIVPGHGRPAPLRKAQAETRDYLIFLRRQVAAVLASGGTMIEALKIDQSRFKDLAVYKLIAGRNAQAVFAEMEFD